MSDQFQTIVKKCFLFVYSRMGGGKGGGRVSLRSMLVPLKTTKQTLATADAGCAVTLSPFAMEPSLCVVMGQCLRKCVMLCHLMCVDQPVITPFSPPDLISSPWDSDRKCLITWYWFIFWGQEGGRRASSGSMTHFCFWWSLNPSWFIENVLSKYGNILVPDHFSVYSYRLCFSAHN